MTFLVALMMKIATEARHLSPVSISLIRLMPPPAEHDCANALSTVFDDDQVINASNTDFTFQTEDENGNSFSQIQFDGFGRPRNIACSTDCKIQISTFAMCLQSEGAIYAC